MQKLYNVVYDVKPKEVTVRSPCIEIVKPCEKVEIKDEVSGEVSIKFLCDVERYTVSEYIAELQRKNRELERQMTQTPGGYSRGL